MMNLSKMFKPIVITQRFFNRASVDAIQAKYLDEQCIEVNRLDEPLKKVTKEDCHRNCKFFRRIFA